MIDPEAATRKLMTDIVERQRLSPELQEALNHADVAKRLFALEVECHNHTKRTAYLALTVLQSGQLHEIEVAIRLLQSIGWPTEPVKLKY